MESTLDRLLRRQDGIVARWQALRFLSIKAVEHKVRSGRWRRVHRALYTTSQDPLTANQRNWLAVLAAAGDNDNVACLAGVSALRAWGLRGIEASMIDVLVPHSRRTVLPPGLRLHRSRLPLDLDGCRHLHPTATLPGRSLLDAAQWARSDNEARLITAASFQQRLVTLRELRHAAATRPNVRRRAVVLATAEDCAGGSHSLAELELLALFRRYGLPVPTRQKEWRDAQGRRRFLDALFEPWRVAVEVDGAHHLDVARQWDDAVRGNALELDGYVVLRFPAFALRAEADRIAADIRRALENAGWTPELGHSTPPGGGAK